jgi:glycosyltransferase involved in cell wall biosynthesis
MPVPPLSIILPNYNHAEFLPRCLEAFLGQSFGDFELIVVDDASTDDSFELLQEYARGDSRIRLYRNSENQGVVGTLNRALSYCRGEFVHGAASDDYILPGYFEAAMGMFRQHPQAGICLGLTKCVNEKGTPILTVPGNWADSREFLSPEELAPQMVTCGVPGPSIWRRDAFLHAGGYNPDLRWHCDWFTLQVVAFRHGLCFLPEVFTVVRMVENS